MQIKSMHRALPHTRSIPQCVPMQPASCIRLQHSQLGCDLWPNVADKDVSVETSRVSLGLRPGILAPDCSVCLPSLAPDLHVFPVFFCFIESFSWCFV